MIDPSKLKIVGNCLNPRKIWNKNLRGWMYVSCEECAACLNQKASKLTNRLKDEILQHKYSVMFTLTYDNQFLPKYEIIQDKNELIQFKPLGRFDGDPDSELLFNSCPYNKIETYDKTTSFDESTFFPSIENYPNCYHFAAVNKKDIQNFLKRLRWRISNIPNITKDETQIRYYIAAEYGPTTLRPHYHGVICFDSKKILDKIKTLIVMSWGKFERQQGGVNRFKFRPFANLSFTANYVKLCDPNTAYYVASYVAGNANLPKVLRLRETKPFHLQSKNPVIGSYKVNKTEVLESIERGTYEVNKTIYDDQRKEFVDVSLPLPEDTLRSIFKKCFEYSSLTNDVKLQLYSFYGKYLDEWKKYVTNEILDIAIKTHDEEVIKTFVGFTAGSNLCCVNRYLCRYPRLKYRNYLFEYHNTEYVRLCMDKDQSWFASKNAFKQTKGFNFRRYGQHEDDISNYISLFDKYLFLRSQYQLKQFYTVQDDLIKQVGLKKAFFHCYPTVFEDNTFTYVQKYQFKKIMTPFRHDKTFYDTNYYRMFKAQQLERLQKSTKQKKLNNTYVYNNRTIS